MRALAASETGSPLHPPVVTIPLAAFFVVLLTDLAFLSTQRPFWAEMAAASLTLGAFATLAAAFSGYVDLTVRPSGWRTPSRERRLAVTRVALDLCAVALNASSLYLRSSAAESRLTPSTAAIALSLLAFALLAASGWSGARPLERSLL